MTSTHRGKIGRLPPDLRDQLNRRMESGERGATLAAWLNNLPEVQAMLRAEYEGKPINEPNLTGWRKHGFKDWLRLRQAQRMAAEIGELPAAANSPLTDQLAAWGSVRYLMAVRDLVQNHADGSSHFNTMREFHRDIIALRRADHRSARLQFEKERTKFYDEHTHMQKHPVATTV